MEIKRYGEKSTTTSGSHEVGFLNPKGEKLVGYSDNHREAEDFARKLRYSKKCVFLYYMRY